MRKLLLISIPVLTIGLTMPVSADEVVSPAPQLESQAGGSYFSFREVRGNMLLKGDNVEEVVDYMDRMLYDLDHQRVGWISDLLVDPESNELTHVLVDLSDQKKQVAMPVDQVQAVMAGGSLITTMSPADLDRMDAYVAMGEVWASLDSLETDMETASGPSDEAVQAIMDMASLRVSGLDADQILGRRLITADGRAAGEVQELVIDGENVITHVIVGVGGFLGFAERSVRLPLQSLSLTGDDALYVDMTRDQVEGLPTYEGQVH